MIESAISGIYKLLGQGLGIFIIVVSIKYFGKNNYVGMFLAVAIGGLLLVFITVPELLSVLGDSLRSIFGW